MKPIIIYSTPRTRSTATLEAAKRDVQLNEPFGMHVLASSPELSRAEKLNLMIDCPGWDKLVETMSHPNTATKLFGSCVHYLPKARQWFKQVDETNSYEIFCLIRSPREILMSHVLAHAFGFYHESETEDRVISITENQMFFFHEPYLQQFLTYYPKNATTVTFDSLPEEHFDYSKIYRKEQNSIDRRKHCVENLEEVEKAINTILRFYQTEWEDKTNTSVFI